MAALTFVLLSFGHQLFRVGCVFVNSGFSISKCIIYIRQMRRECLVEKCLEEIYCSNTKNLSLKRNQMSTTTETEQEEIEIIDGFEEVGQIANDVTFYDFIDHNLVYADNNLAELHEGVSFMINGKTLLNCERFSINFIINTSPHRDIALHVNPRLPQNYIVRNHKVKGQWGKEEVTSEFPFTLRRGKDFSIQVLITETNFLISLNGSHFASFFHRMLYKKITCLEIKGDVKDIVVNRSIVSTYPEIFNDNKPKIIDLLKKNEDDDDSFSCNEYPSGWSSKIICGVSEPSMPMPFYGILPEKLLPNKRIRIEGRVKVLPHSFFINLQVGNYIWPHPTIAFHFNPRFANVGGKHVICRNSWYDNKWDQEERSEMRTDFMPGKSFTIFIYCGESGYEVYLNRDFLIEYDFRVKPEIVDMIYLQGDIKLWNIVLEDGVSRNRHHNNY